MKAKEVMRRKVVSLSSNLTVGEVAKILDERRISGAPVVAKDGRLIGVVSRTDLVHHEREEPLTESAQEPWYQRVERVENTKGWQIKSPDLTRVTDLMTPVVVSADESAPVEALARVMVRRRIHRVIITKDGKMTGIVSSLDLVRALLARKPRSRSKR